MKTGHLEAADAVQGLQGFLQDLFGGLQSLQPGRELGQNPEASGLHLGLVQRVQAGHGRPSGLGQGHQKVAILGEQHAALLSGIGG